MTIEFCRHLNWLRRSSDERRTKGKAKKWGPGELHEGSRFESILGANPWSAGQQNPETEQPWFVVFCCGQNASEMGLEPTLQRITKGQSFLWLRTQRVGDEIDHPGEYS
jgi:hypothetical protein